MAELKVRLALDSSAISRGLSAVTGTVGRVFGSLSTAAARLGGAFAAIGAPLSAGAFAAGIKGAINYASEVSDAADRTGIAAGQLAVLQQAFRDAGLSADQAQGAINKMQRTLFDAANGSKEAQEGFRAIGLNFRELEKMSPAEQFEAISKALREADNQTTRSAAGMKIFGRSGAELQSLIKNTDALAKAQQRLGSIPALLDRSGGRLDNVGDSFDAIGIKIKGAFLGAAESLLPALEKVAAFIDNIDLVGFGQRMGNALLSAVQIFYNAIQQGRLSELVGLSLKIAFGEAVNFLAGGIRSALLAFASIVDGTLFRLDFFVALRDGLTGAFQSAVAALWSALRDAMISGAAILQVGLEKAAATFTDTTRSQAQEDNINRIASKLAELREARDKVVSEGGDTSALDARIAKLLKLQTEAAAPPEQAKVSTFEEARAAQSAAIGENIDILAEAGNENLAKAGKAIAEIVAKIAEDMAAIGKDFKPAEVFNTDEWKQAIEALAKSLNIPIEAVEGAAKKLTGFDGEGADISKLSRQQSVNADQFARAGFFASSAAATAGGVADIMRSVSDHTRGMLNKLNGTLNVSLQGVTPLTVANS